MISTITLAWLQLSREKVRLGVAFAGVAFAVILVFMQLGFQDALFASAVTLHRHLAADLVMIDPQSAYLATMKDLPRRQLYQALAVPGVEEVTPLSTTIAPWKNPYTGKTRDILVIGVDPDAAAFDVPEINAQRALLRSSDRVLFDREGRPEFGPVVTDFEAGRRVSAEILGHRVTVDGLFPLGVSFGVDGTLLISEDGFSQLFPHLSGTMSIGLVKLRPGTDARAVRDALAAMLTNDVTVLTIPEYVDREITYWDTSTPIGYALGFGVIMGWCVGAIIVYQILFTDVTEHLPGYATLKAMGYGDGYLFGVVLMESLILAVCGYVPAVALCVELYRVTASATRLPMAMAPRRMAVVLGLTILMCAVSGALAMRKVRSADPAELF